MTESEIGQRIVDIERRIAELQAECVRLRSEMTAETDDEPQPDYCDCDGFHDGSCRNREIERQKPVVEDEESWRYI